MCDNVCIHDNGIRWATNQGELKAAIGEFIRDDGYDDKAYTPEMCLCPVDLRATAEKHGYEATKTDPTTGEHDPFDTHFVRKS